MSFNFNLRSDWYKGKGLVWIQKYFIWILFGNWNLFNFSYLVWKWNLIPCLCWVQVLDTRGHLLVALGYGLWPSMVLISEIVQTFILADFCYYYVKRCRKIQILTLHIHVNSSKIKTNLGFVRAVFSVDSLCCAFLLEWCKCTEGLYKIIFIVFFLFLV